MAATEDPEVLPTRMPAPTLISDQHRAYVARIDRAIQRRVDSSFNRDRNQKTYLERLDQIIVRVDRYVGMLRDRGRVELAGRVAGIQMALQELRDQKAAEARSLQLHDLALTSTMDSRPVTVRSRWGGSRLARGR